MLPRHGDTVAYTTSKVGANLLLTQHTKGRHFCCIHAAGFPRLGTRTVGGYRSIAAH